MYQSNNLIFMVTGFKTRSYKEFINNEKNIVCKNIVILKGKDGKPIGRIYDEDDKKIVLIPRKFENNFEYGDKCYAILLEKEKYYVYKGIRWSNK